MTLPESAETGALQIPGKLLTPVLLTSGLPDVISVQYFDCAAKHGIFAPIGRVYKVSRSNRGSRGNGNRNAGPEFSFRPLLPTNGQRLPANGRASPVVGTNGSGRGSENGNEDYGSLRRRTPLQGTPVDVSSVTAKSYQPSAFEAFNFFDVVVVDDSGCMDLCLVLDESARLLVVVIELILVLTACTMKDFRRGGLADIQ
ncbi:CAP-Gly domain-containing linker protein 4 [Sparganum proliferum]